MNIKKILLITALVCASPVIQCATSAEIMYKDLVESVLSKYPHVGPQQKACDITSLQRQLYDYRDDLQNEIVRRYATKIYQHNEQGVLLFGCSLISSTGAALSICYPIGEFDRIIFGPAFLGMAGISLGMSVYLFTDNYRQITLCKNKIKDISEILVKLDNLKKELLKEDKAQQEEIVVITMQ